MKENDFNNFGPDDHKRLFKIIERSPKGMPDPPGMIKGPRKCIRCGGEGGSRHWPGFTCFRCAGSGKDPIRLKFTVHFEEASEEWNKWADERIAKLDVTNEKRRKTIAAKKLAKAEEEERIRKSKEPEFIKENPVVKEAIKAGDKLEEFASGVLKSALEKLILSEKMAAVLEKAVKKANDDTPKLPVPEGRIEVVGELLTTKEVADRFGWGGGTITKMLVRDDRGFKVWGTMPGSLFADRGDRVKFSATVEPSKDDEFFGFFKRPAKAANLTDEENLEKSLA